MLPARSKRKRNSTSTDSERKQYSCGKEIALFQWSRKRNSTSTNSERKQYFFCRFGQEYIFIWKRNWYFFIECGKEIVLLSVSERKQYFSQDKRKGKRHSYSVLIFSEPWSRKGSRWFVKDIEDHLFRFNAIYYRYNPIIDNVRCFFPQSSHDYTFSSYRRYAREVSGAHPEGLCGGRVVFPS